MRPWKKVVLAALLLFAALAAFAVFSIGPRNILGMIRYDQRREGDLKIGDRAPDVELVALDGTARQRLSGSIGGQPLVLIFGSFT